MEGGGMSERAGRRLSARPPAETDRGSRIQLLAIVVITLGLMIGGVLVVVLGEDFPFVPDATPVAVTATPTS